MITISTISEGLTSKIRQTIPETDDAKAEIIEYGIYMIISEITKIAAILIVATLLNVLTYAILTIVVFGLLRNFAGGIHAKTHWGCFISYSVIVFGTVYSSISLQYTSKFLLVAVLYPVCFCILYFYSPADILNKPVLSKKQRKKLRIGSFTFLTAAFILYLITVPQPYANLIVFASFIECLTLLPVVYKLSGNKYGSQKSNVKEDYV